MNWITKQLALDLLAITTHYLQKISETIEAVDTTTTPDPATTHPADLPTEPAPAPAAVEPAPEAEPQPNPAPGPAPQANQRAEAQSHLRDINLNGGMEWITQTLFPHFGVTSLTDIPDDQLPTLIQKATTYKLEKELT